MLPKQIKYKEQTVLGKQEYLNRETGEIEEFTVINKNIPQDFNFHKIWLQDILNVLDSFGNKKIASIVGLLKQMRNEDNTVSGSQRELAELCNVSYPTFNNVMRELISSNVIRRIRSSTYQFNPDLIAKGSSKKRQRLLIQYNYEESDREINRAQDAIELER